MSATRTSDFRAKSCICLSLTYTHARFTVPPQALVAGTTPKTLLARLCEGVRRLLEDSVAAMRKGGASSAYAKLDSPFLVHISFQQ